MIRIVLAKLTVATAVLTPLTVPVTRFVVAGKGVSGSSIELGAAWLVDAIATFTTTSAQKLSMCRK